MSFKRHIALYRVLSAAVIVMVMLTMFTQARQGRIQGASDPGFEKHDICETQIKRASERQSGTASPISIIETPPVNSALTGIIRVSAPTLSSWDAGIALTQATAERVYTPSGIVPGNAHSLRFIPPQPFSSVLRL